MLVLPDSSNVFLLEATFGRLLSPNQNGNNILTNKNTQILKCRWYAHSLWNLPAFWWRSVFHVSQLGNSDTPTLTNTIRTCGELNLESPISKFNNIFYQGRRPPAHCFGITNWDISRLWYMENLRECQNGQNRKIAGEKWFKAEILSYISRHKGP